MNTAVNERRIAQALEWVRGALPVLEAVIGVEGWEGLSLEVEVSGVDERGWQLLAEMAGDEAVEITARHGGKVVFVGADALRGLPITDAPTQTIFGAPVYFVAGKASVS